MQVQVQVQGEGVQAAHQVEVVAPAVHLSLPDPEAHSQHWATRTEAPHQLRKGMGAGGAEPQQQLRQAAGKWKGCRAEEEGLLCQQHQEGRDGEEGQRREKEGQSYQQTHRMGQVMAPGTVPLGGAVALVHQG